MSIAPVVRSAGRATIGWVVIAMGLSLLLLSVSWYLHPIPSSTTFKGSPGEISQPPPDLRHVKSFETLLSLVAEEPAGSERQLVERTFDVVARRFDTCYGSEFTWQQNWILRAAGWFWSVIAHHTAEHLVQYSDCGLCSEVNGTFVIALDRLGVPARLVGLGGHVVAEVFWDDRWHLVDPHYGYFPAPNQDWIDVEAVARNLLLVDVLYGPLLEPSFVDATRESFARYAETPAPPRPLGSANSSLMPWLHRIAQVLKWVIPAVLVLLGSMIVLWQHPRR